MSDRQRQRLRLWPGLYLKDANAYILKHHAHHDPVVGCKFVFGVLDEERPAGAQLCGVAIVGRPVGRGYDNGWILELNRCCTDRTPHVASMLIAASARASFAIGATRIISYVLETESGASYLAAGWRRDELDGVPVIHGGGRHDCEARQRRLPMADLLGLPDKSPTCGKHMWFKDNPAFK